MCVVHIVGVSAQSFMQAFGLAQTAFNVQLASPQVYANSCRESLLETVSGSSVRCAGYTNCKVLGSIEHEGPIKHAWVVNYRWQWGNIIACVHPFVCLFVWPWRGLCEKFSSDIQSWFVFQTGWRWYKRVWPELFMRRYRLDIRKFAFSNRVVDNWNSLSACCVSSSYVNCFNKYVPTELESGAMYCTLLCMIAGIIWRKPVLDEANSVY